MDELRLAVGKDEIRTIEPGYHPGDAVEILTGPLAGLAAVVTRVMPGPQRVAVFPRVPGEADPGGVGREPVGVPRRPAQPPGLSLGARLS